MKRKYKVVQQILDETYVEKLRQGVVGNAAQKEVVLETLSYHLTRTGDITVAYLLDALSSTELSSIKQRLRAKGVIEIVKGNDSKLTDNLSPDDVEFIDARRSAHIMGELKTRVEFNEQHGRPEQAKEAYDQLSLFAAPEETVQDNVELVHDTK